MIKRGDSKDSLIEGEDFYFDASGLIMIFTEKYHLKRGYCCENRCKNCPYGEPKISR